jgi:hypothetical protein
MKTLFIGIDNGVSGTIGVTGTRCDFFKTPVKKVLKYTKKEAYVNRVDVNNLKQIFKTTIKGINKENVLVGLERPMINNTRFTASMSAIRCWEAMLIVIESLDLPYVFIDSKEWQKSLLPSGIKGSTYLKQASLQVGNRLYPQFKSHKHEDRDGLLISEYLRKNY